MIRSRQKSGDAKAHVDCSSGINDTTLLAACLNALEGDNADKALKALHSSIFFTESDTKFVPTINAAVKPTLSKYLCVVANRQHRSRDLFLAQGVFDTLHRKILDCLNCPSNVQWEVLPEWVIKNTKRVFAQVFEAFASLEQKQEAGEHQTNTSQDIGALAPNLQVTVDEAHSYIFNVVATLICLDSLGVREVSCSPLPMILCTSESRSNSDVLVDLQGGMTVNPVKTEEFDHRTPLASVLSIALGISLLRVLTGANTSRRSRITPMILQKHGFGIDDKDRNLKVSIAVGLSGESDCNNASRGTNLDVRRRSSSSCSGQESSLFHSDHVAHLETNLDDISGESLAFAIELLLQHGAIDAWVTPIVMKKGRPAHTLHCLCKDNRESQVAHYDNGDSQNDNTTLDKLLKLIFEHTSTLGVRVYRGIPRAKLERSMVTVTTPFVNTSRKGRVDIKVSSFKNGQVVRKKAEFDHCKEIAIEVGIGVQVVAGEAIKSYDNKSSET